MCVAVQACAPCRRRRRPTVLRFSVIGSRIARGQRTKWPPQGAVKCLAWRIPSMLPLGGEDGQAAQAGKVHSGGRLRATSACCRPRSRSACRTDGGRCGRQVHVRDTPYHGEPSRRRLRQAVSGCQLPHPEHVAQVHMETEAGGSRQRHAAAEAAAAGMHSVQAWGLKSSL